MTRKHTPRHTREELNATAVAAQGGDRDSLDHLFDMMRPYLVSILRRVDQSRYSIEERQELDQAAAVGVMEALVRFDPNAGTKFSTWAYPWVKGEVSEWLARNTGGIPMPRAAWNYAARIEEVWKERTDKSVHEATDDELSSLDIEVVRDGDPQAISIPYAGDIFRARKDTFDILPDTKPTSSVEEEVFGEEGLGVKRLGVSEDTERVALVFLDGLADLEVEAWESAIEDFLDERDIPTTVEALLGAAALLHGRSP